MLPGDEVHNVTNGDFIVLGDVKVTSPITEENGAVVFRGTYSGPLPAGHELDATIEPATEGFRWADGSSGGQFLSAGAGDSGGSITDHGDGTWTARFTGLDRRGEAGGARRPRPARSVGMEHDVGPTGGEVTAFHFGEHAAAATVAAPSRTGPTRSPASTAARSTSAQRRPRASSSTASRSPASPSVQVTLTDSERRRPSPRRPRPRGGAWSARVPAGDIRRRRRRRHRPDDDGRRRLRRRRRVDHQGHGGAGRADGERQPGHVPAGAVNVALTGENVRYTTDGSTPTAGSQAYSRPLRVDKSQTIKAISVDAAGNLSPVAEFAYTIQTRRSPPPVAGPGAAILAAPEHPGARARLRLESLTVARRMTAPLRPPPRRARS